MRKLSDIWYAPKKQQMPIFCHIANRACGSMCAVHQITGTPHVPLFYCHVVSGLNMYREYVLPCQCYTIRGKSRKWHPKAKKPNVFPHCDCSQSRQPRIHALTFCPSEADWWFILLCYVRHNIKIQYQVDHFTTNVSRSKAHLNDKKSKTLALFMERNWLYVWTSSCMTYRAEAF